MIVECEDGDFDFFDIVTDWGEWLIGESDDGELQQKQDQMKCNSYFIK